MTYTQTVAGGNGVKKAWAGRQVAVCVLQNQCGFGVKDLGWV